MYVCVWVGVRVCVFVCVCVCAYIRKLRGLRQGKNTNDAAGGARRGSESESACRSCIPLLLLLLLSSFPSVPHPVLPALLSSSSSVPHLSPSLGTVHLLLFLPLSTPSTPPSLPFLFSCPSSQHEVDFTDHLHTKQLKQVRGREAQVMCVCECSWLGFSCLSAASHHYTSSPPTCKT